MHTPALSLLILLLAACSNPPPQPITPPTDAPPNPAPAPTPKTDAPMLTTGNYDLAITPGPDWQRHTLVLESVTDTEARGEVHIDWGIGPEGRAPMPSERVHVKPWRAALTPEGQLAFEVQIGDMTPAAYVFDLWACPHAGPDACSTLDGPGLAGEVRIASERSSPGIWTVTATPSP